LLGSQTFLAEQDDGLKQTLGVAWPNEPNYQILPDVRQQILCFTPLLALPEELASLLIQIPKVLLHEEGVLRVPHAKIERVLQYAVVVRFCLLRDASDHAEAHLQEVIQFEALGLADVGIVVGGLHHQEQVEVLIALGIVLQLVESHQSLGDVPDDAVDHLRLLGQAEAVEDDPHHVVDLVVLELEGREVGLAHLPHLIVVEAEVLAHAGLGEQGKSDGLSAVGWDEGLGFGELSDEEGDVEGCDPNSFFLRFV
jgi:hypothetical protein